MKKPLLAGPLFVSSQECEAGSHARWGGIGEEGVTTCKVLVMGRNSLFNMDSATHFVMSAFPLGVSSGVICKVGRQAGIIALQAYAVSIVWSICKARLLSTFTKRFQLHAIRSNHWQTTRGKCESFTKYSVEAKPCG